MLIFAVGNIYYVLIFLKAYRMEWQFTDWIKKKTTTNTQKYYVIFYLAYKNTLYVFN